MNFLQKSVNYRFITYSDSLSLHLTWSLTYTDTKFKFVG